MLGGAANAHVQQTIIKMIVVEGRSPGDMPERILTLFRQTDFIETLGPLIGKQILAELDGRHQPILPTLLEP